MIALPFAVLLAAPGLAQPAETPTPSAPSGGSGATGGGATGASGTGAADPAVEEYVSQIHQTVTPERMAAVTTAATAVRQAITPAEMASKARVQCWLDKIADPSVDDRLLEWSRICPPRSSEGLMSDSRCDTTSVQRDLLLDALRDPTKFEDADRSLHLTAHVRSLVLVLGTGDRVAGAPRNLDDFDFDVKTAATELAKVASDSRSLHYVALKQWIATKSQDPKSLYNLCPLGG
jgi:hypothetical protein